MIKLNYKEHGDILGRLKSFVDRFDRNDLCSNGKEIWYIAHEYLEKEIESILDDDRKIEDPNYGVITFPKPIIYFDDLNYIVDSINK